MDQIKYLCKQCRSSLLFGSRCLTDNSICNNERVQIQRRKTPLQKIMDERVKKKKKTFFFSGSEWKPHKRERNWCN